MFIYKYNTYSHIPACIILSHKPSRDGYLYGRISIKRTLCAVYHRFGVLSDPLKRPRQCHAHSSVLSDGKMVWHSARAEYIPRCKRQPTILNTCVLCDYLLNAVETLLIACSYLYLFSVKNNKTATVPNRNAKMSRFRTRIVKKFKRSKTLRLLLLRLILLLLRKYTLLIVNMIEVKLIGY